MFLLEKAGFQSKYNEVQSKCLFCLPADVWQAWFSSTYAYLPRADRGQLPPVDVVAPQRISSILLCLADLESSFTYILYTEKFTTTTSCVYDLVEAITCTAGCRS
jgi:hypothetical protein